MKPKRQLLFTWLGATDVACMAAHKPTPVRERLLRALGPSRKSAEKLAQDRKGPPGPIDTLVRDRAFDQVHVLSTYPPFVGDAFRRWIPGRVQIHPVRLSDPTDHEQVYLESRRVLSQVLGKDWAGTVSLSFHLSSGTPTMATIWVLLGKVLYPARLYRTYRGTSRETRIPFDIFLDYVPELLRDTSQTFRRLAEGDMEWPEGVPRVSTRNRKMKEQMERATRAALYDVPILIEGETGTGKELFARYIHEMSPRRNGPFQALNCGAVPEALLEAELFGHTKGAFTGADRAKKGLFEVADEGTLFLDEIDSCSPRMQVSLLRVLQPAVASTYSDLRFRPVGSNTEKRANVRLVTAMNRSPEVEIREGRFREDLYRRISVVRLRIPPLRERREDIAGLARDLLAEINSSLRAIRQDHVEKKLSAAAMRKLRDYGWPGNVRQLRSVLVRAAVLHDDPWIRPAHLDLEGGDVSVHGLSEPILDRPLGDGFSLDELLDDVQRHYLRRALREASGNKTQAARLLGLRHYQTLSKRMKRLGVS